MNKIYKSVYTFYEDGQIKNEICNFFLWLTEKRNTQTDCVECTQIEFVSNEENKRLDVCALL